MDFTTALFYVFAAILVLAATQVITARSPVHAALFLVLSFFSAAGIWMLLQAEFLAIVLVLVYVGAVMVLFLFVVMMLDVDFAELRQGFQQYLPIGALIGAIFLVELLLVAGRKFTTRFGHAVHGSGAKSGAPRAALRVETCALPGALPDGLVSVIDRGAGVTVDTTNVIARRSVSSGGRSRVSARVTPRWTGRPVSGEVRPDLPDLPSHRAGWGEHPVVHLLWTPCRRRSSGIFAAHRVIRRIHRLTTGVLAPSTVCPQLVHRRRARR